jgi:hypothetical protein
LLLLVKFGACIDLVDKGALYFLRSEAAEIVESGELGVTVGVIAALERGSESLGEDSDLLEVRV